MIAIEEIFHECILSSTSSITTSNTFNMSIVTNLASTDLKIVLFNDIIIYDDNYVVVKFFIVTKIYFNIWQKKFIDTINISEKKMNVNKYYIKNQIRFDTCIQAWQARSWRHWQEVWRATSSKKMNWTTQFISYAYFCFVVWRTIHLLEKTSKRKNRIVVNIRELNKIIQFDAYFIQLQSNFISTIIDCLYINIFDCISFFHQWLIKITHRH